VQGIILSLTTFSNADMCSKQEEYLHMPYRKIFKKQKKSVISLSIWWLVSDAGYFKTFPVVSMGYLWSWLNFVAHHIWMKEICCYYHTVYLITFPPLSNNNNCSTHW
jgi:hypothetical protein